MTLAAIGNLVLALSVGVIVAITIVAICDMGEVQ